MKIRDGQKCKYTNERNARFSFYDAQYDYRDSHKTSLPISKSNVIRFPRIAPFIMQIFFLKIKKEDEERKNK